MSNKSKILASFTDGSRKGVGCIDRESNQWTRLYSDAAERIAANDVDGDGLDDLIGVWPDLEGIWMRTSRDDLLGTWPSLQGTWARTTQDGTWE